MTRTAVKQLVEMLDEQYWKLQDRANSGYATDSDYLAVFSRARAASALDFSLDVDPYVAASEGEYKVLIAVDDLEAIRQLIAAEIAR